MDEANFHPIGGTTKIWLVTHQHYGIFVLVSPTSFRDRFSNVGFFLRAYLRAVVTCVFVMKTLKFVLFHIIIAFNLISYRIYPLILYAF